MGWDVVVAKLFQVSRDTVPCGIVAVTRRALWIVAKEIMTRRRNDGKGIVTRQRNCDKAKKLWNCGKEIMTRQRNCDKGNVIRQRN